MTQQRRPRQPQPRPRPQTVDLPAEGVQEPVATSPEPTPHSPILRVPLAFLRQQLHLNSTITVTGARVENYTLILDVHSPDAPAGAVELLMSYRRFAGGPVEAMSQWVIDRKPAS
jgi:hypothetical protein